MLRWLLPLCCAPLLFAQSDAIQKMMNDSADAWNRGDLPTFASYYEDSPQTTFMGREIVRGGTQAILERYRKSYPNRDAMGTAVRQPQPFPPQARRARPARRLSSASGTACRRCSPCR